MIKSKNYKSIIRYILRDMPTMHLILGCSLLLIAILFASYTFSYSQADEVTTQIDVENSAPEVTDIVVSSLAYGGGDVYIENITPDVGVYKEVHISGVVIDDNGYEDITNSGNVEMIFYRSSVADGIACTEDKNDCYKVSSCTLGATTETTVAYDCEISLAYFIDATDVGGRYEDDNWIAYIKVTDGGGLFATDSTTAREMQTILSLGIPTSIDYGALDLGELTTNSNNQEMILEQQGNDEADVKVSGVVMNCDVIGSIPVTNQQWALSDVGYDNASSTVLTSTLSLTDILVGYHDDDSAPTTTKPLYWNLGVPSTGVKGACTGENTLIVESYVYKGIFEDSAVANVDYSSPSYSGATDANGYFIYKPGETTTFSVGAMELGAIGNDEIDKVDRKVLIPELFSLPRNNAVDTRVVAVARFLQSLDDDGDPTNGITITDTVKGNYVTADTIEDKSATELNTLVTAASKTLVSASQATAHLEYTYAQVTESSAVNFAYTDGEIDPNATTTLAWNTVDVTPGTCVTSNGDATWAAIGTTTDSGTYTTESLTADETYTLTCGSTGGDIVKNVSIMVIDSTPDAFSFTDATSVEVDTLTTSNSINIAGFDGTLAVSVSGDGNPQVSINGGAWGTSGTITSGQSLQVRLTSNSEFTTEHIATVTVGEVQDIWSVTTKSGVVATGGTETEVNGYATHTFTSSGSLVVNDSVNVDILILAGGGGGGNGDLGEGEGGGGGAGGFKYFSQKSLSAGTHNITVGAGGNGSPSSSAEGSDGADSSLAIDGGATLVAIGGGGGGSRNGGFQEGRAGGSAGGGGQSEVGGAGIINQGNNGGSGVGGLSGGGGGGAGGAGASSSGENGGAGGAAVNEGVSSVYDWTVANGSTATFSINGTGSLYAGGGGGGGNSTPASGGGGGAGNGGKALNSGGNATDGTGSGGGGQGGDGGDGVVIVRYLK